MNYKNLKLLIDSVANEKRKFNWINPYYCLAAHCSFLIRNFSGSNASAHDIEQWLECDYRTAENLYYVKSPKGIALPSQKDPNKTDLEKRKAAVRYLKTLLPNEHKTKEKI